MSAVRSKLSFWQMTGFSDVSLNKQVYCAS
jgi:hypothetical protein